MSMFGGLEESAPMITVAPSLGVGCSSEIRRRFVNGLASGERSAKMSTSRPLGSRMSLQSVLMSSASLAELQGEAGGNSRADGRFVYA